VSGENIDVRTVLQTEPGEALLVLLVDSDMQSRLQGANALLDEGYEVVESESATEAMHILESRDDFDAMIVDIDPIHAPGGLALARYAAAHCHHMRTLVGSSWNEAEGECTTVAAGFLSKPYSDHRLKSAIRRLLVSGTKAELLPAN